MVKKLDLGCGKSKKDGFIGVDTLNFENVDVVHDLNIFPYPFSENEISEIYMDNVLEHLNEPVKVIEELYRICKTDAKVTIAVPYFRSFYSTIDPTHKNFFGVYWFTYFDPSHDFFSKYAYTNAKLKIEKIEFDREWKSNKIGLIHNYILKFAERNPYYYERKISHLFPLNSLTYYLKVVK